jgi:hypothetical protein
MKSGVKLALVGASSFLSAVGCDKHRDEPPQQVAIPEPTPPPPAPPAAADPAPAHEPTPAAPTRVGVAKGVPDGVVVDGWLAGGQCNIEVISEPVTNAPLAIKSGLHSKVIGWALDPTGATVPDTVHVRFLSPATGDYYGTAAIRVVRDDVNSTRPVGKTAKSGFELAFDTDQLPVGSYAVTTVMVFGDKTYICDNGRKVKRVL